VGLSRLIPFPDQYDMWLLRLGRYSGVCGFAPNLLSIWKWKWKWKWKWNEALEKLGLVWSICWLKHKKTAGLSGAVFWGRQACAGSAAA
jgi:hypothetical protein